MEYIIQDNQPAPVEYTVEERQPVSEEYIIQGYQPASMFRFFEDIAAIPHGSGNEQGIAEMLRRFAGERGLYCNVDGFGNVFIRKLASKGYEERPAVMLQGHMDMVCEMNGGTEHDFLRDGLELYIEDGMLHAKGTTLGGDDGAGVAAMMALLDDDSLEAPALECLFTVEEETGLTGAENFDYSVITAENIINLDYEGEGVACASCAGGMDTVITYDCESVPFRNRAMSVKIFGLAGGHSGSDINKCRASANTLMGRLLASLYDSLPFNLISLNGGNKRNAISRECEAVIAVSNYDGTLKKLLELENVLASELSEADSGFRLHINKSAAKESMFTFRSTSAVLNAMVLAPSGVITMSPVKADFVESSSNLGVIGTHGDSVALTWLSRSSVESRMDDIALRFERLAKLTGGSLVTDGRYPGWAYRECELQKLYLSEFKRISGREGSVEAIHAGLECGIITSRIEALRGRAIDCIAIGPDMFDIHTPDERLDLRSCERMYRLIAELLKRIGVS